MNSTYMSKYSNTHFHLSCPLLIYLPLSGGSEHRVHFIQTWRKNFRLHSGGTEGWQAVLPWQSSLMQLSFSNSLLCSALSFILLLKQVSGHVGELGEVLEKHCPPLSSPERPKQIHKSNSLASPWPPSWGGKTQDNTLPYFIHFLLM